MTQFVEVGPMLRDQTFPERNAAQFLPVRSLEQPAQVLPRKAPQAHLHQVPTGFANMIDKVGRGAKKGALPTP